MPAKTCVAPDYLLVDKSIKQDLVIKMKEYLKHFYGDDPEKSPDYSRIINDKHMERLAGLLKKGRTVTGGKFDSESRYIAPTILDEISVDDPVMQEEIFGPILPVIDYNALDEAILFINSRPNPLALYFFSNNRQKQKQIINGTSSGGCSINDTQAHFGNPYLPFGGIGNSGMGSCHGLAGFNSLSHLKAIYRNSFIIDFPFRYPPAKRKLWILKLFLR